jgi:hypothetical protein
MKFMMVVKASKDSETGTIPKEQMDQMFAAMKKYNEELRKAGVLVSVGGLHPSSNGIPISYCSGRTADHYRGSFHRSQ